MVTLSAEFPLPYWTAPDATLYLGDACSCLRGLPTRSVHCVVTSPPYWGLRDYGTGDAQVGAEPSPDCGTGGQAQCGGCFVCSLVGVFREVHRVLRDDGTVWLNLGSSYFSGGRDHRLPSVRACGNGGRGLGDYRELDSVCSYLCDGCRAALSSRRVRNGLPPLEVSLPSSLRDRDIEQMDSVEASPDASPPFAPHSTIPSSHQNAQGASYPSTRASAVPQAQQTLQRSSQESAHTVEYTDDTTEHRNSSVRRTEDRVLSCVACGDSFREQGGTTIHNYTTDSLNYLKPGDDCGVPWRVALALQADGWVLRQDIIWYAPNKMPESVTSRCTKSHEHIFLLAKGSEYYFDAVAVEEDRITKPHPSNSKKYRNPVDMSLPGAGKQDYLWGDESGKNKRDVWIIPVQGYSGAHYATFSPQLITPCILAGTSDHGCCAECGRPYERVVVKTEGRSVMDDGASRRTPQGQAPHSHHDARKGRDSGSTLTGGKYSPPGQTPHSNARKGRDRSFPSQRNGLPESGSTPDGTLSQRETVGWRKCCGCRTDEVVPAAVLDPFVGSGTTVATALQLGRRGIGIDLSETYLRDDAVPRIEAAMRGEKVTRKATVAIPSDTPPAPRRLR